jgi:hypothetical protein
VKWLLAPVDSKSKLFKVSTRAEREQQQIKLQSSNILLGNLLGGELKDLGDFANALGSALSEEQSLAHLDALGVSRHLEHYRRTLVGVDAVWGHDAHDGGSLPDVSQVHRALETLVDGSGVEEDMHVCLKQSQTYIC